MKRSWMAIVPVAVLTLGAFALDGVGTHAQAQPPFPGEGGPGHFGPGGPGRLPLLEGIELTKKQKDAVHQIFKKNHDDKNDLHKQEQALHDQVASLLLAPGKVDTAQLQTLTQQEATLHAQAEAERLDIAVKVHDILTTEQLAQAKDRYDKISALLNQLHDVEHPKKDEN
ncbi:Spy/CpxP family protein refolding chaperone [Acetobacter oeni]|uniref:Periplasmic heavy metal sensor n=1 Tax=Acetobacter oeni TaxID=304077 RepID=A0A511XLW5_9PROT|nr:periplasmic heavy metal sensor [Acetobacter oeni]MBB3882952.1 protein CpxP [Acetobacter oeni]NHO19034.1 periplasmic heavy metal sensor [Acetobacter oeni]GBR09282.1 hypothetical protein AA21952_2814 [Acetobacter oeni LMG 21952]GEN63926.1 hypothetical protein AOE01nite_21500 [Acetobacter oeni]